MLKSRIKFMKKSMRHSIKGLAFIFLISTFSCALLGLCIARYRGAAEETELIDKVVEDGVYLVSADDEAIKQITEYSTQIENLGKSTFLYMKYDAYERVEEQQDEENYFSPEISMVPGVCYSDSLFRKFDIDIKEGSGFTEDSNQIIIGPNVKDVKVGDEVIFGKKDVKL